MLYAVTLNHLSVMWLSTGTPPVLEIRLKIIVTPFYLCKRLSSVPSHGKWQNIS